MDATSDTPTETPPPKRKVGRPPGTKNPPKPSLPMPTEPLLVRIDVACALLGVSSTTLYEMTDPGPLELVKLRGPGGGSHITMRSIHRAIEDGVELAKKASTQPMGTATTAPCKLESRRICTP
jgi:hypothetical protein